MNLSIKNFSILSGLLTFILLSILFFVAYMVEQLSQDFNRVEQNRVEMLQSAELLKGSSNNLTKFARLYVVTGNKKFKEEFNRVLYIRSGVSERPENYSSLYWELLEPLRTTRHPNANKLSFESIIKMLPFDKFELEKLQESYKQSEALVELELDAFNMMIGLYRDKNGDFTIYGEKDQKRAIETLFSTKYLQAKSDVMLPIDQFYTHLDRRLETDRKNILRELNSYREIFHYLLIATVLFYLVLFYLITKKVLKPILSLTSHINLFQKNRRESKDAPILYQDEIGLMTEQFNSMKSALQSDIEELKSKEREINEYVSLVNKNVITSSTDINGVITYVSQAFVDISGYSREELIGRKHSIVKHPDMDREIYRDIWKTISNDKSWSGEVKNKRKDNSAYWVRATIYPKYNDKGRKVGYTAIRIDISAEKEKERLGGVIQSLNREEKQVEKLLKENLILSETDLDGTITLVSDPFVNISGYSREELIGQNHSILKDKEADSSIILDLWEHITHNRVWVGKLSNINKSGHRYYIESTISPKLDIFGKKIGYSAVSKDLTEKRAIESMKVTDSLSNLPNRTLFNESLSKLINRSKRDELFLSLIFINIDLFREFNDIYGQREGDFTIKRVGTSLNSLTKTTNNYPFRLNGDEFAIISLAESRDEVINLSEKIRERIERLNIKHKRSEVSKYLTVSLGVVIKDHNERFSEESIYREATTMLSKAKKSGRNRVQVEE